MRYTSTTTTISAHTSKVSTARFSPDGALLASASSDGEIKFHKLNDNGSHPTEIIVPRHNKNSASHIFHSEGISHLCFTPSGKNVITASDDTFLIYHDVETQSGVLAFKGHSGFAFCVAHSPRSPILASGGFDEQVILWDSRSGKATKMIQAHQGPVSSVDFSHDGRFLLSSGFDGVIRIWDPKSGELVKTLSSSSSSSPQIGQALFSPNSRYVLSSSHDDRLRLFDFAEARVVKTYKGHECKKFCCGASFVIDPEDQNKRLIIGGSEDGSAAVWDLQSRKLLCRVPEVSASPNEEVLSIEGHPTESLICSGAGNSIHLTLLSVPE